MKIKSLILIFLIPLLFVSCSANTELHEMISLENDEYMDIILYNTSTEILEECKEKTKCFLPKILLDVCYENISQFLL